MVTQSRPAAKRKSFGARLKFDFARNWRLYVLILPALTALILEVPVISALFGFTLVSPLEYLIAVSLAFLVIPIVELVKLIQRKLQR